MQFEYFNANNDMIKIPIPESYKDCIILIKSDLYRIKGKIPSTWSLLLNVLKPFKSRVLFWFRLCQYKGLLYPFTCYIYKESSRRQNIQISNKCKLGFGLYLGHEICIIIGEGTVIGNNVNLSQFLNIGTNNKTPAIIGNNVYIGPQVCIVENVIIENNVTIGAGAVVVKNIPQNATVAGVPAKVLNYSNPGRYIGNRYQIK